MQISPPASVRPSSDALEAAGSSATPGPGWVSPRSESMNIRPAALSVSLRRDDDGGVHFGQQVADQQGHTRPRRKVSAAARGRWWHVADLEHADGDQRRARVIQHGTAAAQCRGGEQVDQRSSWPAPSIVSTQSWSTSSSSEVALTKDGQAADDSQIAAEQLARVKIDAWRGGGIAIRVEGAVAQQRMDRAHRLGDVQMHIRAQGVEAGQGVREGMTCATQGVTPIVN